MRKASPKQIQYLQILIDECGYDEYDYDLGNISFQEAVGVIDELKEELGWDKKRGSYHAKRWD